MATRIVLTLLCFVLTSLGQTSDQEVQALKTLYAATGGTNWRIPWTLTGDPCANNWYGIGCYESGNNTQRIFKLVLQGNNLIGTIPDKISDLSYVQYLYLSGNYLEGTVPASLGTLTQLQQLGLDKNKLTGGFPTFKSPGLSQLFLQDNQFTGPLDPIGQIIALQYLYLSRNNITGSLPNNLANMFTLQQFGIDSNQLTGTIPSGFGVKQNFLQSFYAQNNNFTGPFPTNLCSVQECDISAGSDFTCPHPSCCHVASC